MSSASKNARNSPLAFFMPLFLAAAAPELICLIIRIRGSLKPPIFSSKLSVDPSLIIIISSSSIFCENTLVIASCIYRASL